MIYLTRSEQRLAIILCVLLILSVVIILVKRFQPGLYLRASMGNPDFSASDRPVNRAYRTFQRQPIGPRQPQEIVTEQVKTPSEANSPANNVVDLKPSSYKININTANKEELEKLPFIGSVKAQAIIDYRREHGPFSSPEQIMNVRGIGEKTFQKIKERIKVRD